jgi:hypothetical protein
MLRRGPGRRARRSLMLATEKGPTPAAAVERCFKRHDAPRNPTTTRPVPTPALSHRRSPRQCLCATPSASCRRPAKARATKATSCQCDRHAGVSRRDLGTQGETSRWNGQRASRLLTTYVLAILTRDTAGRPSTARRRCHCRPPPSPRCPRRGGHRTAPWGRPPF